MAVSQNIGNGVGMLYAVDVTGTTIVATNPNTPKGFRDMRSIGAACSPISAVRSAVATVTFTATPAGNVTAITIGGVNQIGANVAMSAGNPTLSALAVASAINLYTPGSGDDFTAAAVGATVYIFSSPSGGDAANGLSVTVSVSTVGITFTKTDFGGGSDETGVFDSIVGLRFWLDDKGNAPRDSFAGGEEITKYIVLRGLQTGIVTKSLAVSNDRLTGIDRSCAITNIFVDTQSSAATDELSYIETVDFVQGDVIRLSQFIAGRVVVVTDNTVSVGAGNIYLTDQVPFNCQDNKSIELRLQYDSTAGLIWVENGRSISGGAVQLSRVEMRQLIANGAVQQGQSYFITDVGQAGIIVTGIDSTSITSQGDYIGYFPDYQNVSGDFEKVWYIFDASVTVGKLYAYSGLMYESLTGVTGTDPSTEPTDWLPIAITNSRYQKEILTVQYDIDANRVTQGVDKRGNIIVGTTGFSTFKWGCDTCYGNSLTSVLGEIYNIDGEYSQNNLTGVTYSFPQGFEIFSGNTLGSTTLTAATSSTAKVRMSSCIGASANGGDITINVSTATVTLLGCVFNTGNASISISGNGNVISGCIFGNTTGTYSVNCSTFDLTNSEVSTQIQLQQDTTSIVANAGFSNHSVSVDLDSAMTGNLLSISGAMVGAGIFVCTSGSTKTINQISPGSPAATYPITIKPANGITTIVQPIAIGSAVSGNVINSSTGAITLVGRTNGADFCTIQRNGNLYSVINSKVHA